MFARIVLALILAPSIVVGKEAGKKQLRKFSVPKIEKFKDIRDGKDWENPWARIHAGTIELWYGPAPRKSLVIQTKQIKKTLLGLPASAWPYGGVIAASSSGPQGTADKPRTLKEKTAEDLREICKEIGLELKLWP